MCDEQVSHRSADMAENSPIPPTAAPDLHPGAALTAGSRGLRHSSGSSCFYPAIPILVQELQHDSRTVYIVPIILVINNTSTVKALAATDELRGRPKPLLSSRRSHLGWLFLGACCIPWFSLVQPEQVQV